MHTHGRLTTIVFVGSGAISTALGNILAADEDLSVWLLSIEEEVIQSINEQHVNSSYFPNFQLNPLLKATSDKSVLSNADIVFLGIPSTAIVGYLSETANLLRPNTLLVNLAKGFGPSHRLIPESVKDFLPHEMVVMKGPSFAREIINRQPTAFTIAAESNKSFALFKELFDGTSVYLDFSTDLAGVEYSSILKNIYAIIIGIVDANFDSPNLRSLVLSRAINEMRSLMVHFGGQSETIFKYCGFGDFSLTALNDLSRNRTLGLLIGKGFFTQGISEKVVLEGRIAVNVFFDLLQREGFSPDTFPLMHELWKVFNEKYETKKFVERILLSASSTEY
ncbi:MAG TPA: 2-dehydropantoate 2-reductase N-terminal domain-containing protein [Bacteroidales bacterium]|nr:2-dehydropantoate 2-reductase N-terminal domain-containing protein [Bacteroidales bacterium]